MLKKFSIIFTLSFSLFFLTACSQTDENQTTNTPEESSETTITDETSSSPDYYNKDYKITLKNPLNWEKMEDKFGTLVAFTGYLHLFYTPIYQLGVPSPGHAHVSLPVCLQAVECRVFDPIPGSFLALHCHLNGGVDQSGVNRYGS